MESWQIITGVLQQGALTRKRKYVGNPDYFTVWLSSTVCERARVRTWVSWLLLSLLCLCISKSKLSTPARSPLPHSHGVPGQRPIAAMKRCSPDRRCEPPEYGDRAFSQSWHRFRVLLPIRLQGMQKWSCPLRATWKTSSCPCFQTVISPSRAWFL